MKKTLKIDDREIKEFGNVFIIAEAGVNHNGNLNFALALVDAAAAAGADAVKFQTFKAEQVVTNQGYMADYQKKNIGKTMTQRQMLKQLELKESFYQPIIARCAERKIMFMSTPHGGKESVDFLESLNIPAYKIGSGDLTNYLLLQKVAHLKKPIILSTGMATMQEVKSAVAFIKSEGNDQIAVLHCTTNYPCPLEEVNLSAMVTMMDELDEPVGYSDHTVEHLVAELATQLGMAVYECHFTLDKNLPGPDHAASANPQELTDRIRIIRTQVILGDAEKKPNHSELTQMTATVRKSLVLVNDLKKNSVIKDTDLEAKRPGTGISPVDFKAIVGRTVNKNLKKDSLLSYDDLV